MKFLGLYVVVAPVTSSSMSAIDDADNSLVGVGTG